MTPQELYNELRFVRSNNMSHNEATAVDKLFEMASKLHEYESAEAVAYNGDVVLRYGMTPIQIVNEMVEACHKEENCELAKKLTGCEETYNSVFNLDELEAIAKHLQLYVKLKRKE